MTISRRHCRLLPLFILTAGLLYACAAEDPNVVASVGDWKLTESELAAEYERVNEGASFADATLDQRANFAELLASKQVLLQMAEDAIPEPDVKRARLNRVLYEKTLMQDYLGHRRQRFALSPEERQQGVDLLEREARVLVTTVRQSDFEAIRQAMFDGGEFVEVATRFSAGAGPQGQVLEEMTFGLGNAARALLRAIFLNDVPPGTVVGPVATARGNFFLRVIEYTPFDYDAHPGSRDRAETIVNDLNYIPYSTAYVESLRAEANIVYHPENFQIPKAAMQAFWDSINAAKSAGETIEYQAFRAPAWLLAEEEAGKPIFEMYGKTYSARDFMESLNDVDLDYWVTVGVDNKIKFQIEQRVQRLLFIMDAERMGVQNIEPFVSNHGVQKERHLISEFRDRYLASQFEPDEAALQAEYQENPSRYLSEDLVAYGLLTFAPDLETRAREVREILRNSDPIRWYELAQTEAQSSDRVLYYPDTGLSPVRDAPPDPSWVPFRDRAANMETGELSEVVRTQHGFTILRCNQRVRSSRLPFDDAREQIVENLREAWLNEELDRRIEEAKKRYDMTVYRDRLEALMTGGA